MIAFLAHIEQNITGAEVGLVSAQLQRYQGLIADTARRYVDRPQQAQFISRSNWLYTLERTTDFKSWTDVSSATSGNGTNLFLPDTNARADKAFYRVKAERP